MTNHDASSPSDLNAHSHAKSHQQTKSTTPPSESPSPHHPLLSATSPTTQYQTSSRPAPSPRFRSYNRPGRAIPQTNDRSPLLPPSSKPMAHRRDDPSSRPLIDFVTNEWRNHYDDDLDASDEDEAFYAKDDGDHILPPKWKAMVYQTSNRIPRRVQRYIFIYLGLLILVWVGWRSYWGPRWAKSRTELRLMDSPPNAAFGANMRPEFDGMVMVKELDETLRPGSAGGKERLIVVGDVHGCREELEQLLQKVNFNSQNDHLIFTGDIIAKGPDSPGVISLAQKYSASCVRGNWEDKILLSIADMRSHHAPLPGPNEEPDRQEDMLDEESFTHGDLKMRKLAKTFSDSQIEYLQSCPVILKVGAVSGMGEILVVHAGLVPGVPLKRQDPFQCMNMRSIDLETRIPSEKRDGTAWEKFWNHQQEKLPATERTTVIYGHDAKKGKNIWKYSKGLDSGCVRGGKLTAMVIEEGKSRVESVKCEGYV